jgi:choline dehydrogenase-like flavoprotein
MLAVHKWHVLTQLLFQFETYHGPSSSSSIHGSDGPIHISNSSYGPTQLQGDFIRAAADLGIPEDSDLQDLDSNHAVQKNLRYISPDGIRQDSAHAYLHPRLQDGKHPNLHVVVEHEVVRVLSEKDKAVGVEIRPNPEYGNGAGVQTVKAKKMVVVSAGTLGTPLVLERSGVGSKDVLDKAGVEVVSDVPGVGEDFQDHNTMLLSYYTSLLPNETYDDILNGQTTLQQLLEENHEMLAWNSAEITSKIRPTEEEIDAMGLSEGARLLWDRDFKNNKNKPVATISTANG